MTSQTPEETHNTEVERIVEEYYMMFCHSVDTVPFHSTNTAIGELEWLRTTLTQDHAALHTSLVAAVKEKAYKPWDHYNDIPGEVEMIKLEDLLTIINSIFKE